MPEAFAVIAVFAISVAIYAAMWIRSRNPSLHQPHEEVARMEQQLRWLDERLERARCEKWDTVLVAGMVAQRRATEHQLAQTQAQVGAQPTR